MLMWNPGTGYLSCQNEAGHFCTACSESCAYELLDKASTRSQAKARQ